MTVNSFESIFLICIEAPLSELYDFSQQDSLVNSFQVELSSININDFYKNELHEKSPLDFLGAVFFTPPKIKNKTIVLGNSGGWATLCNYICKNIGLRNIQFDMNSEISQIERNSLFVYEEGRNIRTVQAIKSDFDAWDFSSKGTPVSFENLSYYNRRIIKERLSKKILTEYCINLGLNVLNDSFFCSNEKSLYIKRNISNTN